METGLKKVIFLHDCLFPRKILSKLKRQLRSEVINNSMKDGKYQVDEEV